MAWAKCPTHGPIQDASEALDGLKCKCGLICEPYEPESFLDHDEVKALAKKNKQPREVIDTDA